MADRRCFSKKVVESDAFRNLPDSAQALYFHLSMAADDDGFINCAGSVAARSPSGKEDLQILVTARFVLRFAGEIYVIKHWRIGNSLKSDRTKAPAYPNIASIIWLEPNRAYTDHPVPGCRTLYEIKTGNKPLDSKMDSILDSKMDSQENRKEENRTEPNRTEGMRGGWFDTIWNLYPEGRRGNRDLAEDSFRDQIIDFDSYNLSMTNLKLWLTSDQWNKDSGQYIPYLVNWLSRGTWRVVPPEPQKQKQQQPERRELDADEIEAIQRMMRED